MGKRSDYKLALGIFQGLQICYKTGLWFLPNRSWVCSLSVWQSQSTDTRL